MDSDLELLRKSRPDFARLPEGVFNELFRRATTRALPTGKLVMSEQQHCTSLDILLSGLKRIYRIDESGKMFTLFTLAAFEICPINVLSILAGDSFPAHAQILVPARYLSIPSEDVLSAFSKYPEVRQLLLKSVSSDVNALLTLLSEIVFRGVRDRLADLLLRKSVGGEVAWSHQDLAAELGTAREVVSKVLKQMEKEGLVEMSRMRIRLLGELEPARTQ